MEKIIPLKPLTGKVPIETGDFVKELSPRFFMKKHRLLHP
jgi:hypothetical protein